MRKVVKIQGPAIVNITRIVKPGCEEPFEKELHEHIQRELVFLSSLSWERL